MDSLLRDWKEIYTFAHKEKNKGVAPLPCRDKNKQGLMTKRSNILAKISLRDGHVSPWGESRLAISANKQKQTDSRFVRLQSSQTTAKYTRNTLVYSELLPPPTI